MENRKLILMNISEFYVNVNIVQHICHINSNNIKYKYIYCPII